MKTEHLQKLTTPGRPNRTTSAKFFGAVARELSARSAKTAERNPAPVARELPARPWHTPKEVAAAAACSVELVRECIARGRANPADPRGLEVLPHFRRPCRIPDRAARAFVGKAAA